MKNRTAHRAIMAAILALAASACGPSEAERAKQAAVVVHDSAMTRQNDVLQAQKDSVLLEAKNLFQAIAQIDSATALAGYKAPKGKQTEPLQRYEDQVRTRTLKALQRLRTVEARLKTAIARADSIGGDNEQMRNELNTLRQTVQVMQAQIASQQARGDSLMSQLAMSKQREDSLRGRTVALGARIDTMGTTIDSMVVESHKVWVIAASKDYLKNNHIVEEVGGTRFPLVIKRGETLRPVNGHPDTTLFSKLDMLKNTVIPLDSTKKYEVVSSQDLSAADTTNKKGRIFHGMIRILDPQRFWRASPYLILRER
jgi:hypothetical protein